MTDPLAHLYELEDDLELPTTGTTLEALTAETGTDDEDLSESDLDELALLVKTLLAGPGLPDDQAAALGLGDVVDFDGDRDLVLNATGRRVLRRLIDEDQRTGSANARLLVELEEIDS